MKLLDPLPSHVFMPPDSELVRADPHKPLLPRSTHCVTCNADRTKGERNLTFQWRDFQPEEPSSPIYKDEIVEWRCNCDEQFILNCWFATRGIVLRNQRLSWSDMTGASASSIRWTHEYIADAQSFINHGIGGIIHGGGGSGKTSLALLLVKSLLKMNIDCYVAGVDLLFKGYDNWKDAELSEWWRRKILSVPLLVIDGIGLENGQAEYVASRFESIINLRSSNDMPTIITTHLEASEMRVRYGERTMEMISGSGQFHDFSNGEPWRRHSSARNDDERKLGLSRPIVFG